MGGAPRGELSEWDYELRFRCYVKPPHSLSALLWEACLAAN